MTIKAEPITLRAYDLLKYALPVLNRLPRDQKFVLGDRLQNHLSELLERLIEATYLPASEKKPGLVISSLALCMCARDVQRSLWPSSVRGAL